MINYWEWDFQLLFANMGLVNCRVATLKGQHTKKVVGTGGRALGPGCRSILEHKGGGRLNIQLNLICDNFPTGYRARVLKS